MKYEPCSIYLEIMQDMRLGSSLRVQRDFEYIVSRFENEGISFLTITLPSFSKGILNAIEIGRFSISEFAGFARKRGSCLPKFLSGFTEKIFDREGYVQENFDPWNLYCVRQICDLYKKAKLDCTEYRNNQAVEKFLKTDKEIPDLNKCLHNISHANQHDSYREYLFSVADILRNEIVRGYSRNDFNPRHGSGATSEKLSHNERRDFACWPIRYEPYFSASHYAYPNAGWYFEMHGEYKRVQLLREAEVHPSRMSLVPKTLESPRIIAIEPSYAVFCQQGLRNWFQDKLENHPLTRNSIRFSDQSYNQRLAELASRIPYLATIDLSEASDRLSLELVKFLLGPNTFFCKSALACRSDKCQLPNGDIITLRKFATAGNSITFPVEAYCFYAIAVAAILCRLGKRVTPHSIMDVSRTIAVYGDDIIVPSEHFSAVGNLLESFGLKVNEKKSFCNSLFRESCGADFYDGVDVKPVYLRINPLSLCHRLSDEEVVSITSSSNQFYMKGLWSVTKSLRAKVSAKYRSEIPIRSSEVSGIVFRSVNYSSYNAWDKERNCFRSRCTSVRSVLKTDDVTGNPVASISLCLENIGNLLPTSQTQSVKGHAFKLTRGWLY